MNIFVALFFASFPILIIFTLVALFVAGRNAVEIDHATCKLCGGDMVVERYKKRTFRQDEAVSDGIGYVQTNGVLKCSECGYTVSI